MVLDYRGCCCNEQFPLSLQLGEFLSLTDETVEGYEPPSLITEMHLHLQDLRLEYWYSHVLLHVYILLCVTLYLHNYYACVHITLSPVHCTFL